MHLFWMHWCHESKTGTTMCIEAVPAARKAMSVRNPMMTTQDLDDVEKHLIWFKKTSKGDKRKLCKGR